MNSTLYSPALSAFNSGMQFTMIGRKQWANVPGAPMTGIFTGSSQVNGSKLYVNGFVLSDRFSVYDRTVAALGLCYKLTLNSENYLSVGLSGGFNADQVDLSRAKYNLADDQLGFSLVSVVNPLFGSSIAFGNTGLNLTASIGIQDVLFRKNVFAYLNKSFVLSTDGELQTSVLYKNSLNTGRYQLDLNALYMYRKMIGLGIGFRNTSELVLSARFNVGSKFQFGYSYDMSFGKLNALSGHELFLRMQLPSRSKGGLHGTGYTNPLI